MAFYYDDYQLGQGQAKIYIGSPYQRGHGIGSFLGGLFRKILPLLQKGAKTVGKEAAKAGVNIINDMTSHQVPIKTAFKTRFAESANNLKRKAEEKIDKLMTGSGYKRRRIIKKRHSKSKSSKRKVKGTAGKKKQKHRKKSKKNLKKKPRKNSKQKSIRKIEDIFVD